MADSSPLISVIVPVYEAEKYLDQCVQSIVDQTYKNLEIILVDDGSPDNCPAMCDEWSARDGRVRVIHMENSGVSNARNAGITAATGEWLIFIDSDDVVSVYLIEALVKASTSKDVLTVAGIVRFSDELPVVRDSVSIPQNCGKSLAPLRGGLYCCGALYNRELVRSIDLWFDPTLRNIEDVVWNSVYLRYVSFAQFIATPVYYYRINPTSITSHCGNSQWQVSSWLDARRSILNWFADKTLTQQQKKEVRDMVRHCQNNIHAECLAGGITYEQLQELEKADLQSYACNETLVAFLEKTIRHIAPRMYFAAYLMALRLRKTISRMMKT